MQNPFYVGIRIGKSKKKFGMLKLRSMIVKADKTGVDSTSLTDNRITRIGRIIRRFKIDEVFQLWNVLLGQMSIVGPRPNVERDVKLYTNEENKILEAIPGVTDISSIVFSDEGEILESEIDPDLAYNQLIRPWKSRLALFYIKHSSLNLDLQIIILTLISLFNKEYCLNFIYKILKEHNEDQELLDIVMRKEKLQPYPPPGSDQIVIGRQL